jgi:hypothetical protein
MAVFVLYHYEELQEVFNTGFYSRNPKGLYPIGP